MKKNIIAPLALAAAGVLLFDHPHGLLVVYITQRSVSSKPCLFLFGPVRKMPKVACVRNVSGKAQAQYR